MNKGSWDVDTVGVVSLRQAGGLHVWGFNFDDLNRESCLRNTQ